MIDEVREWIAASSSITILTGAGISTESGIPDFRGPNGVWTRDPEAEKLSDIRYYVSDPAIRVRAWKARLEHPAWTAEPNAGHHAIVRLERSGKLHTLVTQNVDGLHAKAGSSFEKLVEIHGTVREVECLSCGIRAPMERALERVRAGESDPACTMCGGILKSATISFGQQLIPADVKRAEIAARECDLFIAVGTSLVVFPVAMLPQIALDNGARLVIVNAEPTPMDADAHAVLREKISAVLPVLVA
ncbi:MAG: SIR2 family NAD-dependent protein deacylase [Actinomycetota bacterium]